MTDLAEMKRLAEAATPGPWQAFRPELENKFFAEVADSTGNMTICHLLAGDIDDRNVQFIAAANPAAVLELIERVKKAEEVVEAARHHITHEWDCRTQIDSDNYEILADPIHPACDCSCKKVHAALAALDHGRPDAGGAVVYGAAQDRGGKLIMSPNVVKCGNPKCRRELGEEDATFKPLKDNRFRIRCKHCRKTFEVHHRAFYRRGDPPEPRNPFTPINITPPFP